MGLFSKILNSKKEENKIIKKNEIDYIYDNFKDIKSYSKLLENSDLLVDKYNELKDSIELKITEYDIYKDIENKLKMFYQETMNELFSFDYDVSLDCVKAFKDGLQEYKSKYFDDDTKMFVNDITEVIENFSVIYYKFEKNIPAKIEKDEDMEELYNSVIEYALTIGHMSASLMQRKFAIGYNRALRIMQQLEERKIIGPINENNSRELLIGCYTDLIGKEDTTEFEYFSVKYGDNLSDNSKTKELIDIIDNDINGLEFESICKDILIGNGYEDVTVTKSSGDYGVDIICTKGDVKHAIQCKKYSQTVGITAVQEIIASREMFDCHVGIVITNNFFTKSADELAKKNKILLWDRKKLIELINNAK